MRYSTINIIGAGCIGHLLMLRFSKVLPTYEISPDALTSGHPESLSQSEVNLYARSIKKNRNIQYQSPTETFDLTILYSMLNQWKQPDLIIICVKYPQLDELCQQLSSLSAGNKIDDSIPILIMMNGMGVIEIVSSYFPNNQVFQAVTTHGARFEKNSLSHTGCGDTQLGGYQGEKYKQQRDALCKLLNTYLPKTFLSNNIEQTLWKKLLINAVINPLTTIHNIDNGQIISNPSIKQESYLLCQELSPLLCKLNAFEDSQQLFEQICFIAKQTKNNTSSMLQDHLNHKKSEIESITGYLLNKTKRLNIELPLHNKIYRKIKRLENHF